MYLSRIFVICNKRELVERKYDTHMYTQLHTQTHRHTDTQAHKHTETQKHTHTHVGTVTTKSYFVCCDYLSV